VNQVFPNFHPEGVGILGGDNTTTSTY